MAGRRAARRTALFLLYQWDVTGQPLASLYEGEVDPFAQAVAESVVRRAEELDRQISAAAEGWPAERLGTVELEEGDVPAEVAISEAVALAKRYATDEGGRLVNGILGRIQREMEANAA
jgi:N utilization substance protein B